MATRFELRATISSDNLESVKPVAEKFVGTAGNVKVSGDIIEVVATIEGDSAKELNRTLLSGMRKVEKKTRLRAEWSSENTVERYFDYVMKSSKRKI